MKTLAIASVLGLASASAFAQWTLPGLASPSYSGYSGPITFFSNGGVNNASLWTDSTIYIPPTGLVAGPAAVDALPHFSPTAPRFALGGGPGLAEDTWGIGKVSSIVVGGPNSLGLPIGTQLWNAAGNPVELTFTYYGLVDGKVDFAANGTGRTATQPLPGGAFIDVYYDYARNFDPTGGAAARGGGAGLQPLNAANVAYPTVTDGTHWLSLEFKTGVDSFTQDPPAALDSVLNGVVSGSAPYRGNDNGYLSVGDSILGTGVDNWIFKSNSIATDLAGVYRGFTFDTPVESQNVMPGWVADNYNKTMTINTTAFVPEPATIATNVLVLLGAGLGAWRYRSRKA